jgi:hypothetical protein
MTALLSVLTSGAFGSALGSLFQWLNRKTELAAKKMEYEHEEKMADLKNQQALALADKAKEQVREAGEQTVAKVEADAFVESQKSTSTTTPLSDMLKSWMRASITAYLLILGTYLAWNIGRLVGGLESLDTAILIPIYTDIIAQVFFLVNLTVSWFFGARGTASSKRKP